MVPPSVRATAQQMLNFGLDHIWPKKSSSLEFPGREDVWNAVGDGHPQCWRLCFGDPYILQWNLHRTSGWWTL